MDRVAALNTSAIATVAQSAPSLLAAPFAPAVDNVAQFSIPVVNAVLGAGFPILVIFGMQIAAHVAQVEPSLPRLKHPRARTFVTLAVVCLCVVIVSAIAAMLACLLAGVQVASGVTWLALFALNTAHMLGHALFFVALGLLGGEMLAALPLIVLLNCACCEWALQCLRATSVRGMCFLRLQTMVFRLTSTCPTLALRCA